MKGTDGDGRADVRRIALHRSACKTSSTASNPRLGIDNWVYVANDGADGKIVSPEHPERPPVLVRKLISASGRSASGGPASGPTQFGLSFNDWRPLRDKQHVLHHAVVPLSYLARSPALIVPAVSDICIRAMRPCALSTDAAAALARGRTRVRRERYPTRAAAADGRLSGYLRRPAGVVYTGDAFPSEYAGDIFTGEVASNLVRRDKLTPGSRPLRHTPQSLVWSSGINGCVVSALQLCQCARWQPVHA